MNYINNNTIILMALSSLMINGCVAKNELQNKPRTQMSLPTQKAIAYSNQTKKWKNVSVGNKEDCVDCYAKPATAVKSFKVAKVNNFKLKSNEVISYDYSKAPTDTFNNTIDYSKAPSAQSFNNRPMAKNSVAVDTYNYDAYDYTVTADDTSVKRSSYQTNTRVTPQLSYVNSSRGGYSNKTAIQIGAFRRFAGAQSYAKKYDLLSKKYHVEIKTGVKDNQPLHRVRIEGFSNRSEAKSFIARYGISDAFLVRK